MKLLAISIARLTVLTEIAEWNPRNTVSIPDFTRAFVERYGFLKFPKTVEEYDLQKGVAFGLGRVNQVNIEAVTFFHKGVVVDTRSSTQDSETVLADISQWAEEFFDAQYSPISEPRKFFLSELAFHSQVSLDRLNPKLRSLAARLTDVVSRHAQQQFNFETIGITFLPDLQKAKMAPSSFRIERLADSPFEENKYVSSAPLPTDEHLSLLEEFEAVLKA